jgi:tetratricopeptide (TPR) repeat protein
MTCSPRGAPRRLATALVIAGVAASAVGRADATADHLARGRALYDAGDFLRARDELLAAYRADPRAELLFALGQVELNLGHFAQAIDYYQRFLATNPAPEQAALAQQAIGAARARLAEKPAAPPPPRPPLHRMWDDQDTGIAAIGSASVVAGTVMLLYALHGIDNHGGTLSQYDARLSRATVAAWAGAGCLVTGAAVIGGALLRWRLHLVDAEVRPVVGPSTAGVSWVQPW